MITCITIHGVRSRGRWQKNFDKYIRDSGRTDIYHIPYRYGFIPAFYSIIPFIRRYHTNRFRKWLYAKIYPLYGENLNVVAHSFGTYIAFHALKTSLGVDRLICFGGVLHCREDFNKIVPDKIEEIHNFHSLEDEVAKYAPQGHCGYYGFRKIRTKSKKWHRKPYLNLKVINHRLFFKEHTGYFPDKFSDILKLLT